MRRVRPSPRRVRPSPARRAHGEARARAGARLLAIVVALSTGACATAATSYELRKRIDERLTAGEPHRAMSVLEGASRRFRDKDSVLFHMLEGSLAHYAGVRTPEGEGREKLFLRSEAALQHAEQRIDALYTKQIGRAFASFLSNPTTYPFEGEAFEKVQINVLRALTRSYMGQLDEALVEARKVNQALREIRQQVDAKRHYRRDGFARLLSGMLYEASGELDEALIAYEKAAKAYESLGYTGVTPPSWLGSSAARICRTFHDPYDECAPRVAGFFPDAAEELDAPEPSSGERGAGPGRSAGRGAGPSEDRSEGRSQGRRSPERDTVRVTPGRTRGARASGALPAPPVDAEQFWSYVLATGGGTSGGSAREDAEASGTAAEGEGAARLAETTTPSRATGERTARPESARGARTREAAASRRSDEGARGMLAVVQYIGRAPRKNEKRISVSVERGIALARSTEVDSDKEQKVSKAIDVAQNMRGQTFVYVRPTFERADYRAHGARLRVLEPETGREVATCRTDTVQDLEAVALQDLEDRMARIRARNITRAFVKWALARAAGKGAEAAARKGAKEGNEEAAGALAGLFTRIVAGAALSASEQADTRSWYTLPARFGLCRLELPVGSYRVEARVLDDGGSVLETRSLGRAEVREERPELMPLLSMY